MELRKPDKLRGKCCRAINDNTVVLIFRYTWVYSKDDTMAHAHRPVVTS